MKPTHVYLAIFFAVLCMSTASILIKLCTAPVLIIALYRVLFTCALAIPLGGKSFMARVQEISRQDLIYILGAGFFLALHFAFWITSLDYTSVSSSVLFTNLQVIFVLLFTTVLLKEKVTTGAAMGIFIALLGSALIAQGDAHHGRLLGDILALLSGLFVAVYFLAGRKVRSRVDAMTYMALVSAAAGVVLLAASLAKGLPLGGYPLADWLFFVLLALIPGIAGHGMIVWALKYVKAPIASVSILGESVGASILAYCFFHEGLLWYQWIGGTLILAGIYTAAVQEDRQKMPESDHL